jgi:hypothetical protein
MRVYPLESGNGAFAGMMVRDLARSIIAFQALLAVPPP